MPPLPRRQGAKQQEGQQDFFEHWVSPRLLARGVLAAVTEGVEKRLAKKPARAHAKAPLLVTW